MNKSTEPKDLKNMTAQEILDDEFSPENLRLLNTMDLASLVRQELVELPVRRPGKSEWFMCHSEFCQQGGVLELDAERKTFWVHRSLQGQFLGDPCFSHRLICLAVTKQGVPFLWPVKTDFEAGGDNKFTRIPHSAMLLARTQWVRLFWSQERREHVVETSDLQDPPKWPDKPFGELLKLGFKDAMINTIDHPAVLALKGKK